MPRLFYPKGGWRLRPASRDFGVRTFYESSPVSNPPDDFVSFFPLRPEVALGMVTLLVFDIRSGIGHLRASQTEASIAVLPAEQFVRQTPAVC